MFWRIRPDEPSIVHHLSGTVLEPPALVMMGATIKQGRGHFRIAEHAGLFPKRQFRGHYVESSFKFPGCYSTDGDACST